MEANLRASTIILKQSKTMNEIQIIKASDYGIEQKTGNGIEDSFAPIVAETKELTKTYALLLSEEMSAELCEKAKAFDKLLLATEKNIIKTHKLQKDFSLQYGRLCDAHKNQKMNPITQMREKMGAVKKHFETIEADRLKALQLQRAERLAVYVEDAHERNLIKFEEDEFEALYTIKKKEYEIRIELEKQAEADRIAKEKAEAGERERIRLENETLKAEAIERERLATIEADKRAKADADRLAKEQSEAKARQAKEDEAQRLRDIEAKKQRDAYEAVLKAQREEQQKLSDQLKAKEESEAKAKRDEAQRLQSELSKGDEAKLIDLLKDLTTLKTKYTFKSDKNVKMYVDVSLLIDKVINHIKK